MQEQSVTLAALAVAIAVFMGYEIIIGSQNLKHSKLSHSIFVGNFAKKGRYIVATGLRELGLMDIEKI